MQAQLLIVQILSYTEPKIFFTRELKYFLSWFRALLSDKLSQLGHYDKFQNHKFRSGMAIKGENNGGMVLFKTISNVRRQLKNEN